MAVNIPPPIALRLSPTLDMAALAAEPRSTHPADLRDAFDAALRGAGLTLPSRREAAERLKRAFAVDGCTGVLSPDNAARAILDFAARQDWTTHAR